jgi:ER-derived vesicles protein
MTTMRGNAGGYGMGAPSYGGMSSSPSEGGNALDAIRQQTSKIEDMLDSVAEPVKPYVKSTTHPGTTITDSCCHESRHAGQVFKAVHSLLTGHHRYMPAIGRFLIVVTFLEDALRIITQWSDQILYLHDYRHSMHAQSCRG